MQTENMIRNMQTQSEVEDAQNMQSQMDSNIIRNMQTQNMQTVNIHVYM